MIGEKIENAAIVDVETSGTNPFVHSILSIAFVPLADSSQSLTVYIRPPSIEWSDYAKTNFRKFEQDWTVHSVAPNVACDRIESYLSAVFENKQVTLVGHNVGFDIAFTRQLAFLGGRQQLRGISHRAIDTHTMLYLLCLSNVTPWSVLTSDGAFSYFGIQVPDAIRHTALGDALATRELVLKIFSAFEPTAWINVARSQNWTNFGAR